MLEQLGGQSLPPLPQNLEMRNADTQRREKREREKESALLLCWGEINGSACLYIGARLVKKRFLIGFGL